MSHITVRPAEGEDIPWLLEQLQSFDAFVIAGCPMFPDIDTAREKVDELITTQPFFVAECNGELQGFICGILNRHFFNPEIIVLTELLWWVPEEHRGGRAGAALFSAFMDVGKREANWIIMTLESNSPVKAETLTKRGFRLQEMSFLCEVAR
jgi:hypothetical protein